MKKISFFLLLFFPLLSFAKSNGFYLGVQPGYSSVNYTNSDLLTGYSATSIQSDGIATHLYLGYNFLSYLGSEFGIVYSHKPAFVGIPGSTDTQTIKNNIIYLTAKAAYPFAKVFSLYAKGGMGYVARGRVYVNDLYVLNEGNIVVPVYGAGLSYRFYRRFSLDTSWLESAAKNSKQLPVTNFVGMGIFYQFYS